KRAIMAAIVLGAILGSAPAMADPPSPLPKGYASDELPQLPASSPSASPRQDVTRTQEAPPSKPPSAAQAAAPQQQQPAAAEQQQGAQQQDEYADTDPSALTDFREPLAPYGVWVEDPTYGTVWVPSAEAAGPDFAPYVSSGSWSLTSDGDWYWVSDY